MYKVSQVYFGHIHHIHTGNMKQGWASLAFLALLVTVLSATDITNKTVVSARLECCSHKWKNFPVVRMFAGQDLHLFHNVKFKNVYGAYPELLFLNAGGDIVERIDFNKLNREEMNELLLKKGFYKKANRDDEVPEKYRDGPYVEREEL